MWQNCLCGRIPDRGGHTAPPSPTVGCGRVVAPTLERLSTCFLKIFLQGEKSLLKGVMCFELFVNSSEKSVFLVL